MGKDAVFTIKEWNRLLKSRIHDKDSYEISYLLSKYHHTPATSYQERYGILDKIDSLCRAYIRKFGSGARNAPLFDPVWKLGINVQHQKRVLKSSMENWSKLKSLFDLKRAGRGKRIRNTGALEEAPSTFDNYWLERFDPQHRSWGTEQLANEPYQAWLKDEKTTLSFWSWLDLHGLGQDVKKRVKYLTEQERKVYEVIFDKGLLYVLDRKTKGRKLFSTKDYVTNSSGRGWAIYVLSFTGKFYTNSHKLGEFHHSSFLSGERVWAAGEWVVENGKILMISNKTGHYFTNASNLFTAITRLKKKGSIKNIIVEVRFLDKAAYGGYRKEHKRGNYYKAEEFFTNLGNVNKCEDIDGKLVKQHIMNAVSPQSLELI
jgi:hypothetical protein